MQASKRGIKTIEVIVAVGVVLILAAILYPIAFPQFVRCVNPARRQTCQSNLKECALAVQLYCSDYDDWLPSSTLVNHSLTWNKRDLTRFATRRGKLPAQDTQPHTWVQTVYDKMKDKDIMFCPDDNRRSDSPRAVVSYWWKLAIDKAWFGAGCSRPYRRTTDYPRPRDCILLYEHDGRHCGRTDGLKNDVQANVALMDTHVTMISLVNATSGDPINCAANSDGEPMYFNFDNTKPKGAGNPPPKDIPAEHVDPGRYSDMLP